MERAAFLYGSRPSSLHTAAQLALMTVWAEPQHSLYLRERVECFNAQLQCGHLLCASVSSCSVYNFDNNFENSFVSSIEDFCRSRQSVEAVEPAMVFRGNSVK